MVSDWRTASPQPVDSAWATSGRLLWSSRVEASASVSASTVPSVSMMVRRLSGAAAWNCSARASGSVMALWASISTSSSCKVLRAAAISRSRNMRILTTLEISRANTTVSRVAPMIRFFIVFSSRADHRKRAAVRTFYSLRPGRW